MCEVFVRNHISQRVTYLRMEQPRFHLMNCAQLSQTALQRSSDGQLSDISDFLVSYHDIKGKVKPLQESEWEAFLSSVSVQKRENAKWGYFEIAISMSLPSVELPSEDSDDEFSYTSPFRHTDPTTPRSRRKRTMSIKLLQKKNKSLSPPPIANRRNQFLSQTHRRAWKPSSPLTGRSRSRDYSSDNQEGGDTPPVEELSKEEVVDSGDEGNRLYEDTPVGSY